MKIKQKPFYLAIYLLLLVAVSPLGFGASFNTAFAYKCSDQSTYYEGGECRTYKKIDPSAHKADGSPICPSDTHHQDSDGTCWAKGGPSNGDQPTLDNGQPINPSDISCRSYEIPDWLGKDKQTYYYADRNSCCAHLETGIPGLNDQIDPTACVAPTFPDQDPSTAPPPAPDPTQDCTGHGTYDPNTQKCSDGTNPSEAKAPTGDVGKVEGRCGQARVNIIVCSNGENVSGNEVFGRVLKIALMVLSLLVGVAALGGLAWASVTYARATDDAGTVSEAKKLIRNIVIGLLLYGFLLAIVNWLVPGSVFGGGSSGGSLFGGWF